MTDINAKEVLARLASALGSSSEDELAKSLDVAPATIQTWKKRNKVPYDHIVKVAAENVISVDAIIFGTTEDKRSDIENIADWSKGITDIQLGERVFGLLDEELCLSDEGLNNETLGIIISVISEVKKKLPGGYYLSHKEQHNEIVEDVVENYLFTYHQLMHITKNSQKSKK